MKKWTRWGQVVKSKKLRVVVRDFWGQRALELRGMQLERVEKERAKKEDVWLSPAQPVEPDSALKL